MEREDIIIENHIRYVEDVSRGVVVGLLSEEKTPPKTHIRKIGERLFYLSSYEAQKSYTAPPGEYIQRPVYRDGLFGKKKIGYVEEESNVKKEGPYYCYWEPIKRSMLIDG